MRTDKTFLESLYLFRMPLHWQVYPCLVILFVNEPVTDAITAMFDSSSKKRDREAGLMSHMCSLTGIAASWLLIEEEGIDIESNAEQRSKQTIK